MESLVEIESSKREKEHKDSTPKQNLLKNWAVMSPILLYCIFSVDYYTFTEIFSLWAESDKKFGGLSFSSEECGEVFVISGFGLLLFQLVIYHQLNKLLGPIVLLYLYMTYLSGTILSIVVNSASLLMIILSAILTNSTYILQNNAVPQDQRGAANGISMTAMSIFKAVAPAAGGAIFSWAQKRQHAAFFPGDQMVFFILSMLAFVGFILTLRPFLGLLNK